MQTDYRIDDFQQVYFAVDSFEELFEATQQDFAPIYDRMTGNTHVHEITAILDDDKIYTKGTQQYANSGGRKST